MFYQDGNVWEWNETDILVDGWKRCGRGGAFNYGGGGLRSSNRVHHPGDWRIIMAGLRCATDWPDGPVE